MGGRGSQGICEDTCLVPTRTCCYIVAKYVIKQPAYSELISLIRLFPEDRAYSLMDTVTKYPAGGLVLWVKGLVKRRVSLTSELPTF